LEIELNALDIASMKFAPIKSVEVERSLSLCKSVLETNCRVFNCGNLNKYIVSHWYQDRDLEE